MAETEKLEFRIERSEREEKREEKVEFIQSLDIGSWVNLTSVKLVFLRAKDDSKLVLDFPCFVYSASMLCVSCL